MWSGFGWLRKGFNVGILWTRWWTFGFYKRREFLTVWATVSFSAWYCTTDCCQVRDQVPYPVSTEYGLNLSLMSLLSRTIQLSVLITGTRFSAGGAESSVFYMELTRGCVFTRSIRIWAPMGPEMFTPLPTRDGAPTLQWVGGGEFWALSCSVTAS
jgi:hypothetical protein